MLKHWSSHCCTVHHQTNEEERERADRQADGCQRNECSDEEERNTEMMEQSEDQCWNTSLSGGLMIRRRCRGETTRGTESFHWWLQALILTMLFVYLHAASLSPNIFITCLISIHVFLHDHLSWYDKEDRQVKPQWTEIPYDLVSEKGQSLV